MQRLILLFSLLTICIGCVPVIAQKPSTTLLQPKEADLKTFYDDNIEGIMCLAEHLSPQRMLVGVGYDPSNNGLKVKNIIEGSPAEAVGLTVGDIITRVNNNPVVYPLKIDSPSDLEIQRNDELIIVNIAPAIMKSNNAIETIVSVSEFKNEKYIFETILTGVELNTVQFKTNYDRSKWIISNWAAGFWKFNLPCLQGKVVEGQQNSPVRAKRIPQVGSE